MPNRKYQAGEAYRYGMNGQEKDVELGEGITTAEFWEYDSRIGRRWNVDPKPSPDVSFYACFNNNPILFSDIHGDTIKVGDNMRNNPQSMAGFNAFKNSNAGKKFFKKYDVGGKYEKVTVTFDDASAEQMTQYFSDATDGVTITGGISNGNTRVIGDIDGQLDYDYSKYKKGTNYGLKKGENLAFTILMRKSYLSSEGVQPMYSVQNAILILHEVQHVEIMHRQLRIYNYTRGASIQHTQMQDYSYMKSRLDFFNENFSSFYKFYAKYPSGSTFMQYLGRWVNAGVANGFSTTDNPNDMYDNINKMGEKKTDIKNFKH